MKKLFRPAVLLFSAVSAFAQQKNSDEELMNLSLEELMNVEVVSASKKAENLFDAPFSASVLTKEEIRKAGSTSIMDALRLIPGLIVRQQTNGNYDVHLRGLDNVPPNSVMVNSASTTTLVMIDDRPVYNYLQGGTLWETLPIDVNDVERIEVVRGPVSAMYGPNAVSGVIHIITRKPEKDGLYATANAQYGTLRTALTNASVGYQPNAKFNAVISGNYQHRNRHEVSYYRVRQNDYVNVPDSLGGRSSYNQIFPHPERAMNKYGANAFVNYAPTEKVSVNLSAGLQDSEVQNAYAENLITPLSTFQSNTKYVDLKAGAYGFSGQVSYLDGTQNPITGIRGGKYDFNTLDAYLEYSLAIKNLVLKPGLTYRKAIYDDTQYWDASIKEGVISGRREITTHAASVRTEYTLFNNKLRFFGGIRADKFNYPDKFYLSYQLAANYKPNEKHLLRIVHSQANRAPFIYDTYLDINIKGATRLGNLTVPTTTNVMGNKHLALVTSRMLELGHRAKLASNLQSDVEVFGIRTSNYTELIQGASMITPTGIVTNIQVQNLPLMVEQLGGTLSLNYVASKFQLKPFITVQRTWLRDYSRYYNTADANAMALRGNPQPQSSNIDSGIGSTVTHQGTPAVFGGAYLDCQIHSRFSINVNPYFYSAQTFYHRNHIDYNDGSRGVDHIASKLVLNAKLSYKPIKQIDVFVSGRNITGRDSREFYRTDRIGGMYLGGVSFTY